MTLAEYVAAFGPVAGVFLFLWLNRSQTKSEKADPDAKLDAILAGVNRVERIGEILMDRSKR